MSRTKAIGRVERAFSALPTKHRTGETFIALAKAAGVAEGKAKKAFVEWLGSNLPGNFLETPIDRSRKKKGGE